MVGLPDMDGAALFIPAPPYHLFHFLLELIYQTHLDQGDAWRSWRIPRIGARRTRRTMNRIEKSGWIALGCGLAAVLVAFGVFVYFGPGAARREITRLSSAPVFNAVLNPAVQLHEALADGTSLYADDKRGEALRRAIAPATCSFVAKHGRELLIECGGGFLHYGYRLVRQPAGGDFLILEVEGQTDRVLLLGPSGSDSPNAAAKNSAAPSSVAIAATPLSKP